MNKQLKYDDETHTYTYDNTVLKSVTEIASEICNINKRFFSAKAAADGTDIHSELARYYDPADVFCYEDFTMEKSKLMSTFLQPQPTFMTEVIVHNQDLNYAGTIDLVSIVGNDVKLIVDFKSGTVSRKYCTVQLSLYKLALESIGYNCDDVTCLVISPKGQTKIHPVSWEDAWNMAPSILDDEEAELLEIESMMQELRPVYDEYKALEEKFRTIALQKLQSAGATKYSGELFDVSYVAPSVRIGLDTARLKAERPDVFEAYSKETNVSAGVKLTNKKEN